jgi:hypothetical protein
MEEDDDDQRLLHSLGRRRAEAKEIAWRAEEEEEVVRGVHGNCQLLA